MRIESIRPILLSSNYGDNNVLGQPLGVKTIGIIEVTSNSGIKGYGESYVAIYVPELFKSIANELLPRLINIEFNDPREIYNRLFTPFVSRNGLVASVMSALDIALWDLRCKEENQSLSDLLGIAKNKKKLIYFSGGSAACNENDITKEVESLKDSIFHGYKIRIGRKGFEADLKRINKARGLWDKKLMVDAIMGTIRPSYSVNSWASISKKIKDLDLYWIEEPIDPDNIMDIKSIKELLSFTQVATGEALTGKLEIRSYLNNNYLDILQLDVTHLGGISPILDLLPELITSNKQIAMHVWGSPLSFCANIQVASLLPNAIWIEYPGVKLDCFKEVELDFYNRNIQTGEYIDRIGFSNYNFSKIEEENKYIKNSGFVMPSS